MAFLGRMIKRKAVKTGLPVLGAWAAETLISKGLDKFKNKRNKKHKSAVGKALIWGISTGAAAGLIRYMTRRKALGM